MNKKIIPFVVGYLLLFAGTCLMMLYYDKADLHMMLNAYHCPVTDMFFKYYSTLAEWPLYIVGLIPMLFSRPMWTAFYALSEIVGAILVSIVKLTMHSPRPVFYFKDIPNSHLPLVNGVNMGLHDSFPSGHSCTFFVFFTFTALLLSNYYAEDKKSLKPILRNTLVQQSTLLGLLFLAAVGCYSRVYLSQHFLLDVSVGSLIGIVVPCVMFCFFKKKITRIQAPFSK